MRTKEEADAFLQAIADRGEAEFDAAVAEAKRIMAERDARELEALNLIEEAHP